MKLNSEQTFDKPLVNVNETTLSKKWQQLFCAESPLPAHSLYIQQPNSPDGGHFTAIISILLVALLFGLILLAVFGAVWYLYLLWLAITIAPHFLLWPRYLAQLEKENAQLGLERFGCFLLPQVLLLRESFHSPNCTVLPRASISSAAVIKRQRHTSGTDILWQIRYQDAQGQEQNYETLWVPDHTELVTDWIRGADVWDDVALNSPLAADEKL